VDGIDKQREEALAKKKLEAYPEVGSSTVPVIELSEEKDVDMLKGVKADIVRTPSSVVP
jgi:hypothetical protein